MNKKTLLFRYVLIWIIASSIGLYSRFYPLRTYAPRESSEKATVLVLSKLKNQVKKQVYENYPQIADHEKNIMINKLYKDLIRDEGPRIQSSIHNLTKNIVEQSLSRKKNPYLMGLDSF